MRLRLKYVLPPIQTLVAVALEVWTYRWEMALRRVQDMPGTPPSFTLLVAINAPLAIPRVLVFRYLPGWWDDITFAAAIAVFWYWVSLNIESWRRGRRVYVFSWMPLRLAADTLVVGIGVMWAYILWHGRAYGLPATDSLTDWLWAIPCVSLPALWSAVLILFFGRDFISAFRTARSTQ